MEKYVATALGTHLQSIIQKKVIGGAAKNWH
jgi:hypothetical protein